MAILSKTFWRLVIPATVLALAPARAYAEDSRNGGIDYKEVPCPPHSRMTDIKTAEYFHDHGIKKSEAEQGLPRSVDDWATDTRQLTSILGVIECWDTDVADSKQRFLSELYTSWVIEEVYTDPSLVRDYGAEQRKWIERIFMGRTHSLVITAKVNVREPDVEFTYPLMAVDYNGKAGKGEAFATTLTRSDMTQPLFRISPNSSVKVEISAQSSNAVDVRAAGLVVDTLKDALALAGPGSTLVTTLNKEQISKVASTLDSGISKIWSNSVAETISSSRTLNEWFPDSSFMVSVVLPGRIKTEEDSDKRVAKDSKPTPRRLWFRVKMTCPRLSVFDSATVCDGGKWGDMTLLSRDPWPKAANPADSAKEKADATKNANDRPGNPGVQSDIYKTYVTSLEHRVTAHQVLNYRMGGGKTLREFLTSQDWFIAFSRSLAAPETKKEGSTEAAAKTPAVQVAANQVINAGPPIAQFCESVVDKLYGAGLSRLDANIGLWAIAAGLPDFSGSAKAFLENYPCVAHFPGSDDGRWKIDDRPVEKATDNNAASAKATKIKG